jgi:hypothetical protein
LSKINDAFEKKYGPLVPAVSQLQGQEHPQPIIQGDLEAATRTLPKSLRTVTLMRLTDTVAGPYADNLKKGLQNLRPPFDVHILRLLVSEFPGVIACQNGADDMKVGKALVKANIVSEIKPMDAAAECKQIRQATDENGNRPLIGDPEVHGTLIFVGHRRPLPPQ